MQVTSKSASLYNSSQLYLSRESLVRKFWLNCPLNPIISDPKSCDVLYKKAVHESSINLFISASIFFRASSVEKSKSLLAYRIFELTFIWHWIFGLLFSNLTLIFVLSSELILTLNGVPGVW